MGGMMLSSSADAVKTALSSGFTQIQGTAVEYIVIGLSAGIGIMAVKMAVQIGLGFFKSIAKK